MTYTEIFNECRDIYKKIYDGLSEALICYEKQKRDEGILFNSDRYHDMFEVLFQYSILQVIGSCGDLSTEELNVLKGSRIERDMIEYIREFKPNAYGWEDLDNMNQTNLNRFLEDVKPLFLSLEDEFSDNVSMALFVYNSRTFNITTMTMLLTQYVINLLNIDNDKQKRYYDNNIMLDCFAKIRNKVNDLKRNSRNN